MLRKLLALFFISLSGAASHAQNIERLNVFSYNVNDGLLQSTIHNIQVDGNNFFWISFPNGIQKFDGNSFQNIPTDKNFPDDKFVTFFRTSTGDILLSHELGVTKYNHNTDRLTLLTSFKNRQDVPATFLGEWDGKVVLYMQTGQVISIHLNQGTVKYNTNNKLPEYHTSNPLGNLIVANRPWKGQVTFCIKDTLYQYDLKREVVITKHYFNEDALLYLTPISQNEVFFSKSGDSSFRKFNLNTGEISVIHSLLNLKNTGRSLLIFNKEGSSYLSHNGALFSVDSNLKIKTQIVNFKNKSVGGYSSIAKMIVDNFGNLYIATINDGIRRVMRHNFPIKYYNNNVEGKNHILYVLPEKENNRILTGATSYGLAMYDTSQQLIRELKHLPNTKNELLVNTIINIGRERSLFFVNGSHTAFLTNSNFSQVTPIPISGKSKEIISRYFSNILFQNSNSAIVQSEGVIFKINFSPLEIKGYKFSNSYIMSGIFVNHHIIFHEGDSLVFLNPENLQVIKKTYLPNTGFVRCYVKANEKEFFVGSNKGIFKIDTSGRVLKHIDKSNGLPDECIYAMLIDSKNNLWCSSNKGIFRIGKDNSIFTLNKEDGLQENEFNTNVAVKTKDGEMFFGGVNGVSSFFPSQLNKAPENIKIFILNISVNNQHLKTDTAVWNLSKIELKYNENQLAFDFIASGNSTPGQYIHQYMLKGVDNAWIQNDRIRTIRYNLQPGKYTLKLYASHIFNKNAKPLKELVIIIHPPFWQTWWFLIISALSLIGLLVIIINRYNAVKFREKLNILNQEKKLQNERERISHDLHDNIGAFAHTILFKANSLEEGNEEKVNRDSLEDMKFAARDILLSLRETIWAFKSEKFSTNACIIRIRNFIQPLSRYYPKIKFQLTDDNQSTHQLPHQDALNLVRIIQEVVTNAIKHAAPTNIKITSKIIADKWIISIADNGSGFDLNTIKKGNGLDNIKRRATHSNFNIEYYSSAEEGTKVEIIVTFPNP